MGATLATAHEPDGAPSRADACRESPPARAPLERVTILNLFAVVSNEFSLTALLVLVCILALSAIMSGLSGFGFSAIGALCLWACLC
jgi:hypothetical protein